ncbi:hypothetical protein A9Q99_25320 [Gammaproteobacteria bacterium 45_16_T64]|nr:hypothetical protein A9Q99_25320 [Gammaproteobacteria bacterium 45_16_T64]
MEIHYVLGSGCWSIDYSQYFGVPIGQITYIVLAKVVNVVADTFSRDGCKEAVKNQWNLLY